MAKKPPTQKQLNTLRRLALERGQSFAYPETVGEASNAIAQLLGARRSSGLELRMERDQSQGGFIPLATDIRDDEVTGYGSTAAWS